MRKFDLQNYENKRKNIGFFLVLSFGELVWIHYSKTKKRAEVREASRRNSRDEPSAISHRPVYKSRLYTSSRFYGHISVQVSQ